MEKKLRFGMVGGGNGGNIGNSHRRGAGIDGLAMLSAGCFTRDLERNREDGAFWGVAPDRIYRSYEEMAKAESERSDGIDFVSIVTPNKTHYSVAKCFLEYGISVVCEKPFALCVREAEELRDLAAQKGLAVCVPYTYAHYPIMRECKRLIETGEIGKIIDIVAEYPQDWMILGLNSKEKNFTSWIGDPKVSGNSNVTAGMGVHLYYLIKSMTGLRLDRVLADFSYYPEGTPLETTARVLLRCTDGTGGLLWTSNTAIGHDGTIELKIMGDKGTVEWSHDDPTHLRLSKLGGTVQILTAGRDYLGDESRAASRLPAGHPEGFYEAFANLYRAFCQNLLDKKNGVCKDDHSYFYPRAQDGVDGVRFVQACVESCRRGNVWVRMDEV